jgi:hypothetical protein
MLLITLNAITRPSRQTQYTHVNYGLEPAAAQRHDLHPGTWTFNNERGATMQVKLPYKWLNHEWVERACTTVNKSDGSMTYSTAAIDDPALFEWIKEVHHPQVTPKQYRNALRDLFRDQIPGYKQSPLPQGLQALLKIRAKQLGRRVWGCHAGHAGSSSTSTASARSKKRSRTDAQQQHKQAVAAVAAATQLAELAGLRMDRRVSKNSLATGDYDILGENSPIVGNEDVDVDGNSCMSDSLSVQELTLEEDSGRLPNYYCSNISNTTESASGLEQLQLTATTISPMQLRSIPEQRFVDEFNDAVTLLYDFGLLSSAMYPELERHYTECFSHPHELCFAIYYTDRHSVTRQHPYANQKMFDVIGVDLTKTMYTLLDLPSLLRIKQMATVAEPGEVMHVPDVFVHCINMLGNVVRKLCDVWIPMVKFNGNMGVFLCALKNTTMLLRQPKHMYE